MEYENEIEFFVSGLDTRARGIYLARLFRTYPGIIEAVFELDSRLLRLKYNPEQIDLDTINRLRYFKDCVFLFDKEEIDRQINILKRLKVLKSILVKGIIIVGVGGLYLSANLLLERQTHWMVYCFLIADIILLIICYSWRKLLGKRI